MSHRIPMALIAVSLMILAPVAAEAVQFDVLLNIGPPAAQDEPGAVDSGGFANGTGGTNLSAASLTTLDGVPFVLTINNVDATGTTAGGIDWRDRGDAGTDPLVRLAEGLVKNNSGIVRVTLEDIPAGYYTASSYHMDPGYSQSEAIKVFTSDGLLAGFQDTGAVGDATGGTVGIGGLTTAIVEASSANFGFVSNGRDPVVLLFDGSAATDTEVPINGVDIVQTAVLGDYARIDFGLTNSRTADGFVGLGVGTGDNSGNALPTTTVTSLLGDDFTVATSSVDWRDRGNSTSSDPLAPLGEDLLKQNAGDITITLGGLPKGEFLVTSFHLDPLATQSDAIEVYITDAFGTDVLQPLLGDAGTLVPVNSLTTEALNDSAAVFFIHSDGINDVFIRFNGTGLDTETPLNGLILQMVVPEPGTVVMLLGLIPLAALALWRRRRSC